MRVAFLGNAPWSVPSLEALAGSAHELVLVVTRSARPAGRGGRLTRTPVAEAAGRLGIPSKELDTVRSGPGFEALAAAAPDVLAVVAYGEILPRAALEIPARVPVNVHFSLLPELRGAAPVQRAILEGLAVTGVTTIRMDEGMDTGPNLLQQEEAIAPTDDAWTLGSRLAALGGRVLVDTLDRVAAGALVPRPQDDTRATYAPKLTGEDEVIPWKESAGSIVRRVRALAPRPGASTRFRGKRLKVFRASETTGHAPPGRIDRLSRDAIVVGAGEGAVALEEVALEGRKRMTGGEFAHGIRPEPGEALGA
jgi:methionyl-tRNA formyltransferase